MNQNQKRILVAVIITIAGMLAYPPFQVVAKNGSVFNMGYGWIIDPPKSGYITATVNVAMLLVQWGGVIVVGGLSFFLTKKTQQQSNASSSTPWNESLPTDQSSTSRSGDLAENATSEQKNGPAGVGGWLYLLVAGMMFIGPLLGAGRINADIMMAERQYPAITSLDEWSTFKSTTWWIYLCVAAISFYGGLGLARGNDWSVVKRAKTILWITGPVASLVLGVLIPTMSLGESYAVDAQFVGAFIGSLIAATIWTAYLSKSKRVRNTYGEKHSEVEKDDQEGSVLCGGGDDDDDDDDDDIRECPKCGMENRIQKISVGFIQKCDKCGNIDYFKEKEIDETSWKNRVLCSDESCIGVIGKDGRCKICGKKGKVALPKNDTKKIGNKEKNDREKVLFSTNHAKKDITSKTQNMIAKGRATQLQKGIPSEHTIENKVISKEKAILEELRNESILTSNEFIEKMAVVKAREEAERFEKLLCSITEPFINKISKLKNTGLLNEQEYEQKKHRIIEKYRAELLDEQERKQKKRAMIKGLLSISEDDYLVMNAQAFDYLDIIDKKKKLGLIKTQDEEMNETFRLQEIHQELVECNEICFKCDAFRKPSDEKCSACGQVFNKE